jgi:hypothetical protein
MVRDIGDDDAGETGHRVRIARSRQSYSEHLADEA